MYNIITKYERVQIISARAKQISEGAVSTLDIVNTTDSVDIATQEYNLKIIPIKLVRNYPNGTKVELDVNSLDRI
jgi:DNA-directed RNA polymerase subunit K/omega